MVFNIINKAWMGVRIISEMIVITIVLMTIVAYLFMNESAGIAIVALLVGIGALIKFKGTKSKPKANRRVR